jgi:hypothetical protein
MAPNNIRMSTCNYDLPACRSHAQQVAHRPLLLPEENVRVVFNFVPDTFHTGRLFGSLLSSPNKSNIIYPQQLWASGEHYNGHEFQVANSEVFGEKRSVV